jgi:hypothetical protein
MNEKKRRKKKDEFGSVGQYNVYFSIGRSSRYTDNVNSITTVLNIQYIVLTVGDT